MKIQTINGDPLDSECPRAGLGDVDHVEQAPGRLDRVRGVPVSLFDRLRGYLPATRSDVLELQEKIMATADEMVARLDAATNEIARDLRAARDAVVKAVGDSDARVAEGVNAALTKFDGPIVRLESLGADESDPVPSGDVNNSEMYAGRRVNGGGEPVNTTEQIEDAPKAAARADAKTSDSSK